MPFTGYIRHPVRFKIGGVYIVVFALCKLTQPQAIKIARRFHSTLKLKRSDQGREFQAMTNFDESSVGLL